MRRNGEISFPWADGDHRFRLGVGELELLQEETGYGPYVLADRMRNRIRAVRFADAPLLGIDGEEIVVSADGEANPPWNLPAQCTAKEISTTIRLGLIGGGMPPGDALRLVRAYVEDRPIDHNRLYAFAIIQSALYGAPEEIVGESDAPSQEREKISPSSPTDE